jgi:hypothetical protein
VTIHVRRVFLEKTAGLFTTDKKAGVIVNAKLNAQGSGANASVEIPAVNLVTIADEPKGRVSVPLEYEIASYLSLRQASLTTTGIRLDIAFAKIRGKNTFGDVLDIAGKALNALPIPASPFADAASKVLKFANDAVDQATSNQQSVPFGTISLAFNRGPQPDIARCAADGKERTGAFALLLSGGLPGSQLVPVTNTEATYCFRYSSTNTYELLAAKKISGACPTADAAFSGVTNDYVMFLISAEPSSGANAGVSNFLARTKTESAKRCAAMRLRLAACGIRNQWIDAWRLDYHPGARETQFKLSSPRDTMNHYAKLAAIGFRSLAIVVLFYSAAGLFIVFGVTRATGMTHQMPMWPMASVLIHPILAVILFVAARPLGEFVARGLE